MDDDKNELIRLLNKIVDNGEEEIKFTVSKKLKEHTTDRYKFKIEKKLSSEKSSQKPREVGFNQINSINSIHLPLED